MIIYTGMNGIPLWELTLINTKYKILAHYTTKIKYGNVRMYISLFKKSGNIKISMDKNTYDLTCYDGTKPIHTCNYNQLNVKLIKWLKTKEK